MNTRMKTRRAVVACLIGAALAAGGWPALCAGQAPGAGLRERISELYLLRLTRALDLTEEQTAKIYPLLTRAEKVKVGIQKEMGRDLRDLRAELAQDAPREKELAALVDRIRQDRLLVRKTDDEVEAALDQVLTPVQKARYLIFNIEFLRNVGENLGRERGAVRGPLIKRTP